MDCEEEAARSSRARREGSGPQYADDTQALRTHVADLRRKIEPGGEPHFIRTDARVGYGFIA